MTTLREALSEAEIQLMKDAVRDVMHKDTDVHIAIYNLDLLFSDPGCEYTAFSQAVQTVQYAAEIVALKCSKIQERL